MPPPSFESFAQNGEDVVLRRALGNVDKGRYVDVGANHPTDFSITWAFYRAGWRGITIEPVSAFGPMHHDVRPEDRFVEAAISSNPGEPVVLYQIGETGLSTLVDGIRAGHASAGFTAEEVLVATRSLDEVLDEAGWHGADIHFMTVDTEGTEPDVLRSIDLTKWQPWVLVIESTAPLSTTPTYHEWEPMVLDAGYSFCLFDGLSRYYVSREHADLAPALSYPAGPLDNFTTLRQRDREAAIAALQDRLRRSEENLAQAVDDVLEWRSAALARWIDAVVATGVPADEAQHLRDELTAIRETVSWRVTKPLRMVQSRVGAESTKR